MPSHLSKDPNSSADSIRLKGVRQNNLKGFDLDIPHGKYTVVTGLSGAGKSSLVFDTLHAEGQRRYVETFSAYTRQFLDLLAKPNVDSIENIRPSIAIQQTNTVKTSRSTVGTMTELTDYFKVWFSHSASCFDPVSGELIEDDNPEKIWYKIESPFSDSTLIVTFKVTKPENITWDEILKNLKGQGYIKCLLSEEDPSLRGRLSESRIDDLLINSNGLLNKNTWLLVAQDRLKIKSEIKSRFIEAVETAFQFGSGHVRLFNETLLPDKTRSFTQVSHYSKGLHSPTTGRTFRSSSPSLFSFNSPLGACPKCKGFGRIIELDLRLAIPDQSLSIDDGALKCWEGEVYSSSKEDLKIFTKRKKIPTNVPFAELSKEQQAFIIEGEPGYGEENNKEWPKYWYGVRGFFRWLEKTTYKMHVRVFLSRYRAYNMCPDCLGARLQSESLCWKWHSLTLPELYAMPVSTLLKKLTTDALFTKESKHSPQASDLALESILTRLKYLEQVGLGYLTIDRSSRTLSGGEVERVNLTSCLGTSLVDTLFVLDEPSVGLHPRDVDRLIEIIRSLTDSGNTVIVVEHDEAMIRAADHVIEVGPEPGSRGGSIVFEGDVKTMLKDKLSITGAYFSGRKTIPTPEKRRSVDAKSNWLTFNSVTKHNIKNLTFKIPLKKLVCLSGVSGSGKSTLLDNVIYQGLLSEKHQLADDPAMIASIVCDEPFTELVFVDQSPLSRTPRSNPALYTGAWELIRELYAATPAAKAAGCTASDFSFNAGDGRCPNCTGLGFEKIEMQFLSDVFVPCAVCEGKRFRPQILSFTFQEKSIADLLETSVTDSLPFFSGYENIRSRLSGLVEVGLGYLKLGQPINTLSGGEAQRLKLIRYLGGYAGEATPKPGALLLLDEPTTGLHRHDVKVLISVLQNLVDQGHTLIVIEHNLDVLKSADWILEIGPDAGINGGKVIAEGTPELIAKSTTETASFLRKALGLEKEDLALKEQVAKIRPKRVHAITLTGARENNLKNISVRIPHHTLTVVTGVSGSGKSTLAFDLIFAEGQRRFMESMSPYARQFVEQLPRPDLDRLTGIPPTVAIEQRITRGSRKSTVATITEVAQYLRLLYARLGIQYHPETDREVVPLKPNALNDLLLRVVKSADAKKAKALYLCAPLIRSRKGHHQPIAEWISKQGYSLMRADKKVLKVESFQKLDRYKEHDIEVIVCDLKEETKKESHIKALETALSLGKGTCFLLAHPGKVLSYFSTTRTDQESGESFPELDPKHFSFNSPQGWCAACRGHGRIYPWMLTPEDEEDEEAHLRQYGIDLTDISDTGEPCPECHGERLNRIARAVKLPFKNSDPLSLPKLLALTPAEVCARIRSLLVDSRGKLIIQDIAPQIEERLAFLERVGLGYLALDRSTETLSGGEAQRIRLAAQLGSNLSGVLYVLDEPSIGLHARDNTRLIRTLKELQAKGNTLIVVEHDDELMEHADHIIDLGPAAGIHGGEILAEGTPDHIKTSDRSLTGLFLAKGIKHPIRGNYRSLTHTKEAPLNWIELSHVNFRNIKGIDLKIPTGRLVMIAGPSGAGKSTLFRDVLAPAVAEAIKEKKKSISGKVFTQSTGFVSEDRLEGKKDKVLFKDLTGLAGLRSVIIVDQSPIGKTPRSTPATYLGIFDTIRQFFATLPESKLRGYSASRFSFNTNLGRCPTCEGAGRIKHEMAFMPDTYLPCEECRGLRYSAELEEIKWKGYNIGQVLKLTFEEAATFFDFHNHLGAVCKLMVDCGLGYLTLGQSSPTLSGGEAQRLKLVTELSKGLATLTDARRGQSPINLYLLEEPTIGLHLSDCEKLIHVLHALVEQGHTVCVIEHNIDLLAEADYIVEMGPTGGPEGGKLLYQGNLKDMFKEKNSPTAPYIKAKFK